MSDSFHTLRRRDEEPSDAPRRGPGPRPWSRIRLAKALPWLLLGAFLLLAFLLFGDRFERGRELELVKVVTLRAGDAASETARASAPQRLSYEGPALFQASGWIEADPLPIGSKRTRCRFA